MNHSAVVCPACGAKVRASRQRCPRCRAFLSETPVDRTQLSNRARTIAIAALAIAVAATLFAWWRNVNQVSPAPNVASRAASQPARPDNVPATTGTSHAELRPEDPPFELPSRVEPVLAGGDALETLRAFQDAIQKDPQDVAALYGAGRTLLKLGRAQEAVGPLKQAMATHPDNWSYAVSYSYAAALAQQWSDAVIGFRAARALRADDAVTSFDLGLATHKAGDPEGAVREYTTATELDRGFASAWLGLGISLDRLGRIGNAVDAYETYLRLLPDGADGAQVRGRLDQLANGPK